MMNNDNKKEKNHEKKSVCLTIDRYIDYFTKLISKYGETSSLGSRNALPAFLLECEEYKETLRQNVQY